MVTATSAAATATSAVATNPGASILKTLNAGSGIDTATLVTQLAAAQRATADSALKTRSDRNTGQVSAFAQMRAGLDAFVTALDGIVANGNLAPQPTSSDLAVVSFARDPAAASVAPVNATIAVGQLAAAQTVVSGRIASATAPVGHGTLTLAFGTLTASTGIATGFTPGSAAPVTIAIGPGNDNLSGVRDAINATKSGVTASILNDGTGARLVLKGASGAANGFTLTATPTATDASANPDSASASASLSALAFAPGTASASTLAMQAANAKLTIDGVAVERASNSISDALPGYTLTLNAAQPDIPVTLAAARDPGLLAAAVKDYAAAYNSLAGLLASDARAGTGNGTAGPLYGQSSVRALQSALANLSSRGPGGQTLAGIGIKTARDGTLSVDDAALTAAAAVDTGQIERIFKGTPAANGAPQTDTGIDGTIKALRDNLAATDGGFAIYAARLTADRTTIAADTAALDTRTTSYTDRLSAQLAAMNAAVAAYKSTSSFLTQQIDTWNNTRTASAVTA